MRPTGSVRRIATVCGPSTGSITWAHAWRLCRTERRAAEPPPSPAPNVQTGVPCGRRSLRSLFLNVWPLRRRGSTFARPEDFPKKRRTVAIRGWPDYNSCPCGNFCPDRCRTREITVGKRDLGQGNTTFEPWRPCQVAGSFPEAVDRTGQRLRPITHPDRTG